VRLLGPEFQRVKTLELEGIFCSLAFGERGEKLAIGTTKHSAVLLFSRSDGWCSPVKLQVPYLTDHNGRLHTVVNSISFNNSGSQLCCGYYPSMIFALFDVQTAACIKVLKRPGTRGKACAFSPADDRLTTGGENEPFVFHDILPIPLLAKYRTSVARVTAAATSEDSVIMSAGSRVMGVRPSDGKSLFQLDLGTNIAAAFYPLALRPDGAQAACCMWETDSVALIDILTGSELRRLGPFAGWFGGVKYSPDGKVLLVFGHWGTIMFDSESGAETHSFVDIEDANIHNCAVDASGKFLVTTGKPNGTAFVKDLNSGANVHTLESGVGHGSGGVSFDDAGMRMAYFIMGGASTKRVSSELDVERNGCVIVCDVTDGFRELLRVHLPDLGWAPHLQFVSLHSLCQPLLDLSNQFFADSRPAMANTFCSLLMSATAQSWFSTQKRGRSPHGVNVCARSCCQLGC
jgi:WD40 repeat protein